MSLSTEELFEGFIALLILVVAVVMVKVTIAFTATVLYCSSMNINYCQLCFKKDFSYFWNYHIFCLKKWFFFFSPGQIFVSAGFSHQVSFESEKQKPPIASQSKRTSTLIFTSIPPMLNGLLCPLWYCKKRNLVQRCSPQGESIAPYSIQAFASASSSRVSIFPCQSWWWLEMPCSALEYWACFSFDFGY